MSLIEHLEELRSTVVRVVVILTLSFFVCYSYGAEISEFLLRPLRENLTIAGKSLGEIVYLGPLDKMLSQIQVALWTGVIAASPLWFYQLWRFVRPGLHDHETRMVKPFLFVGLILFWCGVFFAHWVAFPLVLKALMEVGVSDVKAMIDLKEYLALVSKILVLMGLIFQLPNIMVILGFMGIVTKYSLRNMRRYIYVALSIFAAIITPPDVITMMAVWVPLVLLFEVGVLAVAFIVHPYLARVHA